MRRVIITGGNGFIGAHVKRHLAGDFEVAVIDARKKEEGDIVVDLTCRDAVSKALHDGVFGGEADIVIHLASRLTGADNARDLSVLHDNINMAGNVAHLVDALSVDKLIHASTMAVYPNQSGTYNESSATGTSHNSECIYGLSKICSEQLLDFLLTGHAVKTVHLRLAQVYGEGMRHDRVMSHMERELAETNAITVFGDGERVSNFIPVQKVIEAMRIFIENDAEEIYNVGAEQLSYLQLARNIIDQRGDASSSIKKVPEGCREHVILDCSKYQSFIKGIEGTA